MERKVFTDPIEFEKWMASRKDEHLAEMASLEPSIPPAMLRAERNSKLAETDWWAVSDLTMTAEQTAYRKALRDLPSTASPELDENGQLTGVTWPTKPE